jgi:hypothetical protein
VEVRFRIPVVALPNSTDHERFTIEGGAPKTAATFDYETKSIYKLRLRVTDEGGLSYEKTFTVYVKNVNEPPMFMTLSRTTIMENLRIGSEVGKFSSRDPDGESPYQFTLVTGDGATDNAKFRVVKDKLVTNAEFDFEEQSSYSIRVRVMDNGGASYEQVFVINVEDVAGR